jgi:hypothetical protein
MAVGGALVILAAAQSCGSTSSSSSPGTVAPAVTPTLPTTAPDTTLDTTPVATTPPAPVTALTFSGSGIKQSGDFTVNADQWTIAYSYNCSAAGGTGNFAVTVYNSDGTYYDGAVNELSSGATSSTVEHGAGTYYLSVDSECSWSINVTG